MQTETDVAAPERARLKMAAHSRNLRALIERKFPRWSDATFAASLGMSEGAFVVTRRNMGFVRLSDRAHMPPETRAEIEKRLGTASFDEIARALDVPVTWVKFVRRELGHRIPNLRRRAAWTPEQDAELLALEAQGLDVKRIAKRLGRSEAHIDTRLDALSQSPLVARECLNCNTGFMAQGRFLRLCPTCRAMG